MLDRVVRISQLYDFYGPLLTNKQREVVEAYYLQDLSLAEIADELHMSRQGVHDLATRSGQVLEDYEARLGLVARHQQRTTAIRRLETIVRRLEAELTADPEAAAGLVRLAGEVRQSLETVLDLFA
ncbi:MAG: YlxM family DNA-binding protein [Bacillota bacterium]